MTLTMTLCLLGAQLAVEPRLRSAMIAILGVFLGSAFTRDLVSQMSGWLPAIAVLVVLGTICSVSAFLIFRRFAQLDPVTAYFASVPGGLSEMTLMGEHYGGKPPVISLIHVVRIIFVVSVVPIYFRFVQGLEVPSLPPQTVSILSFPLDEAAILTACAAFGVLLGRLVHLPAPAFFGPFLLSAAIHTLGLSSTPPPAECIAGAQIVVGASIGARFSGYRLGDFTAVIMVGIASAAAMVFLAAVFAAALAPFVPQGAVVLFLAFAPGGLTEMSLIALSMDQDPAFIAALHLIRILSIIALATPLFAWAARKDLPGRPDP